MNRKKITILAYALLLPCAVTASACLHRLSLSVRAEESSEVASSEEISEEVSEEIVSSYDEEALASDVQEAISKGKEWLNEKWNTFVAPLIGGVSLSAFIIFVANLVINYRKGHKAELKYQEAVEKLAESNLINEEAKKILASMSEIAEAIGMDLHDEKQIAERVEEKVNGQAEILAKTAKVEPVLRILAQITAKMASASEDMAKSGLIEDVKELEKLLKEF